MINITPYEPNSIYCGECSQLMEALPDNCIDLTITSPPYGNLRSYNGFVFPFEAIARQLYRVTKQGGVVVWVVGDETKNGSESGESFRQALKFMEIGFNLHDTMIYEAMGTGAKGSNLAYWQAFEYMFIFSKDQPKTVNRIADQKNKTIGLVEQGRFRHSGDNEKPHLTNDVGIRTNIWRYNVGFMDNSDKTDHPAPFPEALARDHILSWSSPGDLVFDPMTGSGTTLKMAKMLGRSYLGFEISSEYCDLARQRVAGVSELLPGFAEVMTPKPQQDTFFGEEL